MIPNKRESLDRYRIAKGTRLKLSAQDPADKSEFAGDKDDGRAEVERLGDRLEELQELFYADHRHRLLVVLQATDTGGKDGTIRTVFDGVNPLGVRVASFKRPTAIEAAHDYLWRVHAQVPTSGEIVIFNRSHYEDVLVVRVHSLVQKKIWEKRYRQIVDFERMLADEGTTIVKFFLHISKDEQRQRLQDRIDDPSKHWKFAVGDLGEREHWDDYQAAYEDAISKTSTDFAPWYVVPSERKWYRDLVVATVLVNTLESLGLQYPPPEADLEGLVVT